MQSCKLFGTSRIAGGFLSIQKEPTGLAGGSSYAPVRLCYQQRPNRRIANLASAFLLLAARKRATRVGKAKLRTQFILFQLFLYVIPRLCLHEF